MLKRVPESRENLWRRPMVGILQIHFPRSEAYSVVQETEGETTMPDFTVLKVYCRAGGTLYNYDFLVVESKSKNHTIGSSEPQCFEHLANNNNDSKNVYGLLQCGFVMQFYMHQDFQITRLGGPLHLVDDVSTIEWRLRWMKDNPLFVV